MTRPDRETPRRDRQREHQANERTYLAWLRTSISLIAFGFAIARFSIFLRQIQPHSSAAIAYPDYLGASLVGLGMVTIAIAAWQHNQAYWQIERDSYRPNRWLIWMLAIVIITLGGLSLPLLRPPTQSAPNSKQIEP